MPGKVGAGLRVFVSHTSELGNFPAGGSYVAAVKDAVSECGHVVVEMSGFPAADLPPAELCEERVRSCDVYVGVLGTRYGSPVWDRPELSYTELEFDLATEAHLTRLVFLLNPGAASAGIPLQDAIDREFGTRQDEFRDRVKREMVVQLFSSPGELGRLVERSLRNLDRVRAGEIVEKYLRTLINWLNRDPWPRDRRFGGPVLTPSDIERELSVASMGPGGQSLEADSLARDCRRLVVLGGPGTGKTWLARRTARRCAEKALEELAAGKDLDEVELPLYTTCSRLFAADGNIRDAVVASALAQIGDLGAPPATSALHAFFTNRDAPTVLVIDSLDEAHGPSDRLFQADTLPWRILLTSRPSSWNSQIQIPSQDESCRVGELQPLRYPEDIEPFVRRWFAHAPELGDSLAGQISRHAGLQRAVTVPLILAFYCIIGVDGALPVFRRDLMGES